MPNQRRAKYDLFVRQNENIPIFYQPWWLDTVCGTNNWDIFLSTDKGENIIGVLPFYKSKMKTLSVISNPFLSPYQGILLFYPPNLSSITSKYSFETRVIRDLKDQLNDHCSFFNVSFHPSFENWYPFYWDNYKQTTRYTYLLHHIKDHEAIQANFDNKLKRQLAKSAEKYKIIQENDSRSLFTNLQKSLSKQQVNFKMTEDFLEGLFKDLTDQNQGIILSAKDINGNFASSMLLVWDKDCAYSLVLGMDESILKNDSMKLLLWESIKIASKQVDNYNFEGSMIENVERVFRSFGGKRTPYFNISKFRNRWVGALFTLIKNRN